jgi:hypothetical protein
MSVRRNGRGRFPNGNAPRPHHPHTPRHAAAPLRPTLKQTPPGLKVTQAHADMVTATSLPKNGGKQTSEADEPHNRVHRISLLPRP